MKFDNKNIAKTMDILEAEILNYIRENGGTALQSQIQYDLGFNDLNCNCNPEGKPTRGWFCGALIRSSYDKRKLKRKQLPAKAISWTLID